MYFYFLYFKHFFKTLLIFIFRNNSSQKMIPPEENSGFVLNKNTGIREIKVYNSKEIKPEQDMSPYGFLVNQNFQFKK